MDDRGPGPIAMVRRSVGRFVEIQGVDRAIVLSAQAFSALFPVLILVAAFGASGDGDDIADDLIAEFDLEGDAADTVERAFATPETLTDSTTAFSVVILVFSALAFTRALQRVYEQAWRLEPRGLRGSGAQLAWLLIFSGYWFLATLLEGLAVLSLALAFALWLVTPYLLLGGRVAWRQLVPQALLTASGLTAMGAAAVIFMPRIVASSATQFGVVGVSFALLTWLVVLAFTIVVAAALGASVADPRSPP